MLHGRLGVIILHYLWYFSTVLSFGSICKFLHQILHTHLILCIYIWYMHKAELFFKRITIHCCKYLMNIELRREYHDECIICACHDAFDVYIPYISSTIECRRSTAYEFMPINMDCIVQSSIAVSRIVIDLILIKASSVALYKLFFNDLLILVVKFLRGSLYLLSFPVLLLLNIIFTSHFIIGY